MCIVSKLEVSWNCLCQLYPGLTVSDALDIERAQKAALQIIMGTSYTGYAAALDYFELDTLEGRRVALCAKFGNKAAKNDKHCNWFKPNRKKCDKTDPVKKNPCSFEDKEI
jgi:hypothetical protein